MIIMGQFSPVVHNKKQVISVKKQIHDVGTKVYLHSYNNEKRERDRFIKKKKKKKKNSEFRTRNIPRGRRTLS